MIVIDGSVGEGGGQVLRSVLTLSLLTGRTVRLFNIRAGRERPGLMPQHLAAVQAAARVGRAMVKGARQGSQELTFEPTGLFSGDYHVEIGTAGATSLVLQTVVLPLSFAQGRSSVRIGGGTHVPRSPCYDYLERQWNPMLGVIGFSVRLQLAMAGFYPRGGGMIEAIIDPVIRLRPLDLGGRSAPTRIEGLAAVADLSSQIADRMQHRAHGRLAGLGIPVEVENRRLPTRSPGAFLFLCAGFEHSKCCYTSLGKRGKPAEQVADDSIDALLDGLETGGAVDRWLADQLLLPLALVPGRSRVLTERITRHLLTLRDVIALFLPARIVIEGVEGEPGMVTIDGAGLIR